MKIFPTALDGVVEILPDVYSDSRGYFLETYQFLRYQAKGIVPSFVQDNLSRSIKDTLRGLHLQHPKNQGKLVCAVKGEIFDVAVDVRKDSPTFGQWVGVTLSEDNKKQIYIPPGFAHGFCVTSSEAYVWYKCTDYYSPEDEVGILWSDASIGINWPTRSPLLSNKDAENLPLNKISPSKLPSM